MNTSTPTTLDVTGLPPAVVTDLQRLVDTLRTGPTAPSPRPLVRGIFAEPGKDVPGEVIDEARREMWAKFPREFPAAEGT